MGPRTNGIPRVDKLRSRVLAGEMVLKEGFPELTQDWRETKYNAMAVNLNCFDMYFRQGREIKQIADEFNVSYIRVQQRVRLAVRFLMNHGWLAVASPVESSPLDS